jgi:serine/threonine protein phosphatase 1
MGKTYAIADLHGRFDLLSVALAHLAENETPGHVVFLGDYVDRGPESRQIIERLMAGPPEGWRWTVLRGNHEHLMVYGCIGHHIDRRLWMINGGGATLISYGHATEGDVDVSVVPKAHLAWLAELPFLAHDEHRVFVHAGLDPDKDLEDQDDSFCIWVLYGKDDEADYRGRHIVHGHHQFAEGPMKFKGRTDLDTFAWATGRLVIGVFDDDVPGGPVSFIELKGKPDERMADILKAA